MTDTLLKPDDTGEIPTRIDDLGIEPTADLRHHMHRRDTTSELTQNLAHEIAGLPPRRRPEADITAEFKLIEPPLGLSAVDLAVAQPIAPWERVVDITSPSGPATPPPVPDGPIIPPRPSAAETERLTLLGSLGAELPEAPFAVDPEPEEDGDDVVFRRGCNGGEPIRSHRAPVPGSRLACRLATKAAVRRAVVWTALVVTAAYLGVDLAALIVMGWAR